MIATFTIILFFLLLIGLPVAFSLGMGGIAGIFAFMGGTSEALSQVPIIGYQSIDDFVLTAVPLYILMSQILWRARWAATCSSWLINGCVICLAAWVLPPLLPALFLRRLQALP